MSQVEARSWWADVEHLREAAERRQADADDDDMPKLPARRFERSEPQDRRTVQITGRPSGASLRLVEVQRRRPSRTAVERVGPRPDRIAMWAVLMGVFLCIVALSTAHP